MTPWFYVAMLASSPAHAGTATNPSAQACTVFSSSAQPRTPSSPPAQPCTTPVLSWFYDASAVSADGYKKTCLICAEAVTVVTESHGRETCDTRAITLPDMSAPFAALQAAPVDEICDGPMDTAAVEYWLHADAPKLFSAAGSACWVQSAAVDAGQAMESLVDRLCGGISAVPTVK